MLRITKTENGMVKGFAGTDARITVFKGIPFAADTSGENRWRAPQPAKNWEGLRECYDFGPIAMQKTPGENPNAFYAKEWHVDPEVAMGEDCLHVNIWTPAKTGQEKLPVMVWIFGGGLREGYSYEMEFDGERIASRGVILASIGYRLNAFGFMAHPELSAESPEAPANFGFLDQKAGIKWVKRNIASFGGDPDNITIFGQSAGAMSVIAQMCSPQTKGLFQKGIAESIGGVHIRYPAVRSFGCPTLAEAEQQGVAFFEKLGVKTLAEARALDAKFIEQTFIDSGFFWMPCIDGHFMPKTLDDAICADEMHRIPYIIGNTTDEMPIIPEGESDAEVESWIRSKMGPHAEAYLAICKNSGLPLKQAARIGQMAFGNQIMNEICARQKRDFYYYEFGPTIPGDDAGAFHSSDLWFQFETLMKSWRPFDGHHYDLARKMCNYWTNFAKTGDPNGCDADGSPMPHWKPYTKDDPHAIQFLDEIHMDAAPRSERDRFLLDVNLDAYGIEK